MQQAVSKEEVAEGAVRNGCACLSHAPQLGGSEAGAVGHHSTMPQQARSIKDSRVASICLRMQRLRKLHLPPEHPLSARLRQGPVNSE